MLVRVHEEHARSISAPRDVGDDSNKITFKIPVHLMNIDNVVEGRKRDLVFGLRVGNSRLWSAVHEIEALAYAAPGGSGTPTHVSTSLFNNVTGSEVPDGNAAVFRVTLDVPAGWCDFDTVLTSLSASGVYLADVTIVDSGTVAYIPPNFAVGSQAGDTITLSYGQVKNVGTAVTQVVMDVAFSVAKGTTPGTVNLPAAQTVGGETIGPFSFDVVANVSNCSKSEVRRQNVIEKLWVIDGLNFPSILV